MEMDNDKHLNELLQRIKQLEDNIYSQWIKRYGGNRKEFRKWLDRQMMKSTIF